MAATASGSRLRRLAQRPPAPTPAGVDEEERCELCGEPIPARHRHLIDLDRHALLCACRACTVLFDQRAAGGRHYRLIPDRSRAIADLDLDDVRWSALRIPVELAFFFRSTPAGRTVAFYPGPMGATESQLALDAWTDLEARNPVLATMEPDVEALLVHRAGQERRHWLVPVDRCYDLVGRIRTSWQGLGGGDRVWGEIGAFFAELRDGARIVTREGKEIAWPD
jgi:hypothetical protein